VANEGSAGRFTGRVAVITGAASGIGAATARRLAREGASVVLTDVHPDVETVAKEVAAAGSTASGTVADVSDTADWLRVAAAAERYGPVDVLVCNAFTLAVRPVAELTLESWERQMAVNLTGALLAFQTFLPDLSASRAAGGGSVVMVSSVQALVGLPGHTAYAAAKGGLCALARQLAVEAAPAVRVNSVLPGPILTRAWNGIDEADRTRSAAATVAGRLGEPDEVAAAIAFLSSSDASFITGASLVVDGGWSISKDSA
jgi:glucose 1-dehydrogenase